MNDRKKTGKVPEWVFDWICYMVFAVLGFILAKLS